MSKKYIIENNVNLLKVKESIVYFCKYKSILLILNIKNDHLISILNSLNKNKLFSIDFKISELRINIKFDENSLKHYFGITKKYLPNYNIDNIRINYLINNPKKVIKKIEPWLNKENKRIIIGKLNTFINLIDAIKNSKLNTFTLFYSIEFKNYNGCFCLRNNKNVTVLNVNKFKENEEHIFLNSHIRSLRSNDKNCLENNKIIFSSIKIIRKPHANNKLDVSKEIDEVLKN